MVCNIFPSLLTFMFYRHHYGKCLFRLRSGNMVWLKVQNKIPSVGWIQVGSQMHRLGCSQATSIVPPHPPKHTSRRNHLPLLHSGRTVLRAWIFFLYIFKPI